MKKIAHLLFATLLLAINFPLFANVGNKPFEKVTESDKSSNRYSTKLQTVYICTGSYAYAYHSVSNCAGLNNCKGEIKYTDEYTAANTYGRKPCCKCWSNVYNGCKEDNPTSGGGSSGGGGEGYGIIALVIATTSAIILSNDFYIYPAYSFYKEANTNLSYSQQKNYKKGTGLIFGFRKTFKHSALEYGASNLTFEAINNNYSYSRWGGHFNFVHQILYNKTPDWLKLYVGPSVNSVFNFGYGGIMGSEIKLFDRLKFDTRFELTTQTNQFQAGLIFTYQKKYFWQK